MKKVFLLFFLAVPFLAFSQEPKKTIVPVVIDSDHISYAQGKGKAFAKGSVVMKHEDTELYCDEVDYDTVNNIAHAKGNVKIIRDNSVIYGEDVVYDFKTSNAQMINIRYEESPFFGESEEGERIGREKFVLDKAYLTTCDLEDPHWRLTAKRIFVYPGDKVVARGMILRIGDVPVFYYPKYSHSLKDKMPPIELAAGKTKEWGVYVLSRYRYRFNDQIRGKLIYDYYYKRGKGFGLTSKIDSDYGSIFAKYYSIADVYYKLDSAKKLSELGRSTDGLGKYLEDDRYRAQLFYEHKPLDQLSIKVEFNKYSDSDIMKDYFEKEYEVSPSTSTYALATYSLSNSSLSLLIQDRANIFDGGTAYLPQFEYNFFRQNLGSSDFYFESNNLASNLQSRTGYSKEYDKTWRYYSNNILSYASKILWVNIDPYISDYSTFYTRNNASGYDTFRHAFGAGSTGSIKFYKVFKAGWSLFGEKFDRMRHIITPKIDYNYVHDPTMIDGHITQFDGYDSLSRQDSATFSLDNKLQARNEERTWDFIYFSPSALYTFNEEGEPRGKASYFTSINYLFEVYPKEELSMKLSSNYDIPIRRFTSINVDFTTRGKTKVFEGAKEAEKEKYVFSFGQRYGRQSSALSTMDFVYHISPKLQFKSYLRYEHNTEDMEKQQYVLRTDLHCWLMDFGIDVDRHVRGGKDLNFWFEFTLKAFPDLSFGFDQTYEGAKPPYAEYQPKKTKKTE